MHRKPWHIKINPRITKLMSVVVLGIVLLQLHQLSGQSLPSPIMAQTNDTQADERPRAASAQDETEHRVFLPFISAPMKIFLPLARHDNIAPKVSAPFPVDDATKQSLNAYLTWVSSGDPEGDEFIFEVYLEANDDTPDELIGETPHAQLEPPFAFELDTQYYWQIVAIDARGAIETGPVWAFSTEELPDPPPVGEMIYIPAGEFQMGCDPANPIEYRCGTKDLLHTVYLDAYEIDKYEVTNDQYRACVEDSACNPPRLIRSSTHAHYYDNEAFANNPVLYVSRWDAEDYCVWADKDIPTEAQWEKAARGTIDTRMWPWGNEPLDCTRAGKDQNNDHCLERQDTVPVGSFPLGASPYGVMDMSGNAFEWVADFYDITYYANSPYANPPGSSETNSDWDAYDGPQFVIRGGSNMDNWWYMRTAHRHWGHHSEPESNRFDAPYFRNWRVGFRCARNLEE